MLLTPKAVLIPVVVVLSVAFACDVGVIQVAIATDGIRQTGMDE